MSKDLTDAILGRPRRRRPKLTLVSGLEAEPPPPPPPWDLSMIRLPRWFMPMLRDLMEVAERSFGPGNGYRKQRWVCGALKTALIWDLEHEPTDFAPLEYQDDLIDLLIAGVADLQFWDRPKGGALAQALATLKAGGRLRRVPDNDSAPS